MLGSVYNGIRSTPRSFTGVAGKEYCMRHIITIVREFGSGGFRTNYKLPTTIRKSSQKLQSAPLCQKPMWANLKKPAPSRSTPSMSATAFTPCQPLLSSRTFRFMSSSTGCWRSCPADPTASLLFAAQTISCVSAIRSVFLSMRILRASSSGVWNAAPHMKC